MNFPVFSQLAGNLAFRDEFARDCLLQWRVGSELDFRDPRITHRDLPAAPYIGSRTSGSLPKNSVRSTRQNPLERGLNGGP